MICLAGAELIVTCNAIPGPILVHLFFLYFLLPYNDGRVEKSLRFLDHTKFLLSLKFKKKLFFIYLLTWKNNLNRNQFEKSHFVPKWLKLFFWKNGNKFYFGKIRNGNRFWKGKVIKDQYLFESWTKNRMTPNSEEIKKGDRRRKKNRK